MVFVMDVGNSNTVLGLYEGDELRAHWRIVTAASRAADELRVLFATLFREDGMDPRGVDGCCISSVVPPLNSALEQVCLRLFGAQPIFVGPGIRTGLAIQVENPKEVGADRIVNAVGALVEHTGPLIVIDFGTATTFDVVTARGEYRGGVIVPGIQISADALFERCAKLPRVDIVVPPAVIGRDTVWHIRSGLTYGYADLVDGLIERMTAEMDETPTVIATGGLAQVIAGLAKRIDHVDPFLTLKGLKTVFARNLKDGA